MATPAPTPGGGDSFRLEVKGANELSAALRQAQKNTNKELARSNRMVARQTREWSRAAASSGTPLQRRAAGGIGSSAGAKNAKLTVRSTARAPMAPPAFWGKGGRSGWYAADRYAASTGRQHPQWVGNSWKAGVRGQGPYVLNDVLADREAEIGDLYLDGQWEAIERALPSSLRRRG